MWCRSLLSIPQVPPVNVPTAVDGITGLESLGKARKSMPTSVACKGGCNVTGE